MDTTTITPAARVIRASAAYDLVVTAGFALPWTATLALASMGDVVPVLGAADTVARLLFSTWFAWARMQGASPVLIGFLLPEVAWGLVQGAVVARALGAERRTLAPC